MKAVTKIKNLITSVMVLGVILPLMVAISGCGMRYREGSSGRDSAYINTELNRNILPSTTKDPGNPFLAELIADPNTLTYFAENTDTMGPLLTVMPFDLNELRPGNSIFDVKTARAYFFSRKVEGGFQAILVINYMLKTDTEDNTSTHIAIFRNDGSALPLGNIENDDFSVSLQDENGTVITVYSDDLTESKDDLADTIQLALYKDGREIGKISTLEGF